MNPDSNANPDPVWNEIPVYPDQPTWRQGPEGTLLVTPRPAREAGNFDTLFTLRIAVPPGAAVGARVQLTGPEAQPAGQQTTDHRGQAWFRDLPRVEHSAQLTFALPTVFVFQVPFASSPPSELAAASGPADPTGLPAAEALPRSIEYFLPGGAAVYADFEPGGAGEWRLELRSTAAELRSARVVITCKSAGSEIRQLGEIVLAEPPSAPAEPVYRGWLLIPRGQLPPAGEFQISVEPSSPPPVPGSNS